MVLIQVDRVLGDPSYLSAELLRLVGRGGKIIRVANYFCLDGRGWMGFVGHGEVIHGFLIFMIQDGWDIGGPSGLVLGVYFWGRKRMGVGGNGLIFEEKPGAGWFALEFAGEAALVMVI